MEGAASGTGAFVGLPVLRTAFVRGFLLAGSTRLRVRSLQGLVASPPMCLQTGLARNGTAQCREVG